MKSSYFDRHSNDLTKNLLWGLGGVIIGAGVTYFVTSPARSIVTGFVKGFFARPEPPGAYHHDDQLAEMENEGGVSHVVRPPSTSLDGSKA